MSLLRDVMDGECGAVNPMLDFALHFTHDSAFQEHKGLPPFAASGAHLSAQSTALNDYAESRAQQFVHEFIAETQENHFAKQQLEHSNRFRMDSLLREVEHLETPPPLVADPLSAIDASQTNQWSEEFIGGENQFGDSVAFSSSINEAKWADEYLAHTEANQLIQDSETDTRDTHFTKYISRDPIVESSINNYEPLFYADNWAHDLPVPVIAAQNWTQQLVDEKKESELDDDTDFWNKLAKDWKEMGIVEETDPQQPTWLSKYDTGVLDEYKFNEDNPHMDFLNPFEEGLNKLKLGDLPSAVLLFEAAVQKEPQKVEAWQYLGITQAENEHDMAAIAALKKCVQLDENNLTALMALAVCYTNESMQRQACNTLKDWIKRNEKYQNIVPESVPIQPQESSKFGGSYTVSSIITTGEHTEVKGLFIAAARQSPHDVDPDVQCGLGVLFNLSGEYDKAADCFKAALNVRPNDSALWNRLGATLANGSKSEEAINAYREALAISPGFIRSRFNLGISCINLGAYREAAEHLLIVLNLQSQGRGMQGSRPLMSGNVWSTLRMVMTFLNRIDLYDAVDERDLKRLNSEFNMDQNT